MLYRAEEMHGVWSAFHIQVLDVLKVSNVNLYLYIYIYVAGNGEEYHGETPEFI